MAICGPAEIYLFYVFLPRLWPKNFKLYIKFPVFILQNIKILENTSIIFSFPLNVIVMASEKWKRKKDAQFILVVLMGFSGEKKIHFND